MATGIVLSIDPSGTTGQVQVDEMGENLPFNDLNFPNTGLTTTPPNNSCSFDIFQKLNPETGQYTSYATNLKAYATPTTQTINSPYTGDLTATLTNTIVITTAAAIVTGNITVNGGKVIIDQDAQVNGNLNINSDGVVAVKNKGKVMGGIIINNGGNLKVVNKGKVMGGISINQGGKMMLGNTNGPGYITGAIDIKHIRCVSITADSTINCG